MAMGVAPWLPSVLLSHPHPALLQVLGSSLCRRLAGLFSHREEITPTWCPHLTKTTLGNMQVVKMLVRGWPCPHRAVLPCESRQTYGGCGHDT